MRRAIPMDVKKHKICVYHISYKERILQLERMYIFENIILFYKDKG